MTITEKAAYLKGLVEGQKMDTEAGEGKLWRVLSELVGDMAAELRDLRDDQETLTEKTDELSEEVDFLNLVWEGYDGDTDEEDDDTYYPFGNYSDQDDEDDELPEDGDSDEFGVSYEVECPNCGEVIEFSEDVLDTGAVQCPNCGASLEFDSMENEADGEESDPE
ncbi:MAG: zinc ribbon domain-containing protein [Oscillospiraceae bacterium]|nr:zinc ribbon domain-containing protein [Oscillospiraceae bacterium]